MDIKTQIMTQEYQAGRAGSSVQSQRERERITASTFQGQLHERETKACRLRRLLASGWNWCLLL